MREFQMSDKVRQKRAKRKIGREKEDIP